MEKQMGKGEKMKEDKFLCRTCKDDPRRCQDTSKHKFFCNQCSSTKVKKEWSSDGLYLQLTCEECGTTEQLGGE
jgi:hypothetical protein